MNAYFIELETTLGGLRQLLLEGHSTPTLPTWEEILKLIERDGSATDLLSAFGVKLGIVRGRVVHGKQHWQLSVCGYAADGSDVKRWRVLFKVKNPVQKWDNGKRVPN